jgi:hypothetical protein
MERDTFSAFAASGIKGVVAHRSVTRDGMPGPSCQIYIGYINYGMFTSGQFN